MAGAIEQDRADWVSYWLPPIAGGDPRLTSLMTHPRFAEAARRLGGNMLALAAEDENFDGIQKDLGRFVTTGVAMYLDTTGGITLPRLKEFCQRKNIASPGRARAILLYLRFLRYIVPAPSIEGERARRYEPTRSLKTAWETLMRRTLDAAGIIEPGAATVSERLAEPSYRREIIRLAGEAVLAAPEPPPTNAFRRVFLDRFAGVQVLHSLIASSDTLEYPPSGPLMVPVADLSRKLHVSRTHIARVLHAGEQEELLVRIAGGGIILLDAAHESIRLMAAVRLAGMLNNAACVERAVADRKETVDRRVFPSDEPQRLTA